MPNENTDRRNECIRLVDRALSGITPYDNLIDLDNARRRLIDELDKSDIPLARTPDEPKAQRQDALRYQLEDLLKMAVREGMYDAHQFIADCMAARPIEMNLVDLEMELDAAARPATDYNSRVRAISVDAARVILRRAFAAAAPRIRSEIVSQVMGPMYEDGRLPLSALDEHNARLTAMIAKQEEANDE